eukprot:7738832-Pyramimonas_sp.AAC.1
MQDLLKSKVHELSRSDKEKFQAGHAAALTGNMTPMQKKFYKGDMQCKETIEKGDGNFMMRSALGQRLQREIRLKQSVAK